MADAVIEILAILKHYLKLNLKGTVTVWSILKWEEIKLYPIALSNLSILRKWTWNETSEWTTIIYQW